MKPVREEPLDRFDRFGRSVYFNLRHASHLLCTSHVKRFVARSRIRADKLESSPELFREKRSDRFDEIVVRLIINTINRSGIEAERNIVSFI